MKSADSSKCPMRTFVVVSSTSSSFGFAACFQAAFFCTKEFANKWSNSLGDRKYELHARSNFCFFRLEKLWLIRGVLIKKSTKKCETLQSLRPLTSVTAFWVAILLSVASLRTSSATTANPRPASPARAASIAALSASRLV